ncbi:MAG: DMT family transporter [Aphanocapsa lilacina HA4352-LM1]|jgi:drug/metabolite transporter (DMT)-like permease|nr:DMT family transporter [Aphanocapsa lilacina HA4352-LM1]
MAEIRDRFAGTVSGKIYFWLAVFIFGLANPVVRKLTELGTQYPVEGRNPISLCNVLFVGNLCALPVLFAVYRSDWTPGNLKRLSRREWSLLLIVALLAGALAPALIFQALSLAMVSSVLFVSRLETPLLLALSVWLYGERLNRYQSAGALICFVGALVPLLLPSGGVPTFSMAEDLWSFGMGEGFAALAAVTSAVATILSKNGLAAVPPGIYLVVRSALGAVIFFFVAWALYGPQHFQDAFSPILWQWMLLYGAVIVALGQLFWFSGLKRAAILDASLISSFIPAIGTVGAYFLLGEVPDGIQYFSGTLVIAGLLLSQWGSRQPQAASSPEMLETIGGFKGM